MIKRIKKKEARQIATYLSQTSARLLAGTEQYARKKKARR